MKKRSLSHFNSVMLQIMSECKDSYIFVQDTSSNHYRWSHNAVEAFGLESEYFESPNMWLSIIHPDDFEEFEGNYQKMLADGQGQMHSDYRMKRKDGTYAWMRCNGWYIVDNEGKPSVFTGAISNVSLQSMTDSVTNLKSNFDFRMALGDITNQKEPWFIFILGIDEFKEINDLYSYALGDETLAVFAQKIAGIIPEDVLLYRLDGDGFGLLFPGDKREEILKYYEILQELAKSSIDICGNNISFTISGGVSAYPKDGGDSELLYRDARMALRTAKVKGKNQLVFFSDEILMKEHFKMRVLGSLRESVKMGFQGFSLRYQPLVRAQSGALYGCEVLLRWDHPSFSQGVSPYEFIPVLEDSRLILEVGSWVLECAVKQCAIWGKQMPEFQMSINVSSTQFEDPDFKFFVLDTLTKYGVQPSMITLELTESGKIIDTKEMQHVFDFIRGQGIKIAFDDFGTGYSSLGIFRVLSADELKIDRSFLERISYDVTDQKIITQIINLCHSMNMTVCVEGIETPEIEAIVKQLGPELLQGYYYNLPMTKDEFELFYFTSQAEFHDFTDNAFAPEHNRSMVYAPFRPVQPMSMEDVVNNAHAGIFQVGMDHEFTFLTCNEGYRRMLGYTAKEMDEKFKNRALGFVHPEDVKYVNDEIRYQLSLGDTISIEFRIVKSDGSPISILGTGNVVKSRYGGASLIVVIVENDQRQKQGRILPQKDRMTGLFNKGMVEQCARKALCEAHDEQQFAFYVIDIDHLKRINDKLGYTGGDQIICEIASRIQKFFGAHDIVGRAGGDEFLALIPYVGGRSQVVAMTECLIDVLQQRILIGKEACLVSVSIGISCYPYDGTQFYELFRRADSALYRAKELGKPSYCFAAKQE